MKQDRNRERQHSKLKKTADKARAVKVQATGVAARRVQTEPTQVKAKGKIRGGQTEPVRSGSKRTEPVQKKQVKAERIQTELMQPERAPAKKAAERPQSGRSSAAQIKTASLPRCPYAKKCGGCELQGIPYTEQLAQKQRRLARLYAPYGKPARIVGMEQPYHYRNKVHAVFGRDQRGEIVSGTYQEGTHRIVRVDSCQIEDELADAIICSIRGLLKSFRIKTYDEDSGYGLLRHVLVRRGFQSKEVLVVLVLASPVLPSKQNFVKALRALHPEISSIVLNVNDRHTNMVLGERNITLYGAGWIEDQLCGLRFRLSPNSFYQVNPVQTERLYQKAIELAALTGHERVIDAYCGIGTIGLCAAKKAREVIGVELNGDAVRDAMINARQNRIENARFYRGDAGAFMVQLAEQGEQADVVFMDPPRSGSDEAFLGAAVKLGPERIVYISCNPETQVRDLKYLRKHGYEVGEICPFDLFPFTGHTECIVKLEQKRIGIGDAFILNF